MTESFMHSLLLAAGAVVVILAALAAGGWAAFFAERQAKQMAIQFANEGRMGEPEPAVIEESPDAEERAHRAARQTAINRAAAFIKRQKPGVSDEQAREEAEKLISEGISGERDL